MAGVGGYSVVVAPSALAQMEVALLWWKMHREKAPELLARELDAALALPAKSRRFVTERLQPSDASGFIVDRLERMAAR